MTRRWSVTAIVLAGGRSTRFGGPKLEAEIDGRTLLERAIQAVAPVSDSIILAGPSTPAAHAGAGQRIRVIDDAEPFAGPVVALAGALRETSTELAIVVGGDMPVMVPAVLDAMLDRFGGSPEVGAVILGTVASDLTVPVPPRNTLPLAVRVGAASAAAAVAIEAGDRSIIRLLGRLKTIEIPASEWLSLDPTGRTVADIDVPADIQRIIGHKIR